MVDTIEGSARVPSPDVIRSVAGHDAGAHDVRHRAVGHRIENMTTCALDRFTGSRSDGSTWSVIAKTLQPASAHPVFECIPPEQRPSVLEDLDWTDEPRLYRSRLGAELPHPLRMPLIHGIDVGPELTTIWMEDVDDRGDWDGERYRRTAGALGRLGGAWQADDAFGRFELDRRDIGRLFFGKVCHLDLVVQADDTFWTMPIVADTVDRNHRHDLFELAEQMPTMIGRLGALPEGVCHGDATPDNFREPGDGSIVAIDWAFGHVGPLGGDLGQLLVGRVESGAASTDDIETIATTILDAYVGGLHDGGRAVPRPQIELAYATYLAIRSVFSALLVDHRADLDGETLLELVRRRAAMARFGLDLALRHAR